MTEKEKNNLDKKQYISSKEASELYGFTNDYIARLAREGKIEGQMIGRVWYISTDSLDSFIKQTQKEKKERGKKLQEQRQKEIQDSKKHQQKKELKTSDYLLFSLKSLKQKIKEKLSFKKSQQEKKHFSIKNKTVLVGLIIIILFGFGFFSNADFLENFSEKLHFANLDDNQAGVLDFFRNSVRNIAENTVGLFRSIQTGFQEQNSDSEQNNKPEEKNVSKIFTTRQNAFSVWSLATTTPNILDLNSNFRINEGLEVAKDSSLRGALGIGGRLTVGGASIFNRAITSNSSLTVNGSFLTKTDATVGGVFNVGGAATFNNSLVVQGGSTFSGEMQANGGIITGGANVDLEGGEIYASNIVNAISAGSNVTISGTDNNPIISADTAGVDSIQGRTGALALSGGTDISVSGLTISNTSDLGSVRGRGGCTNCIKDSDVVGALTISGGTINSTPIGSSASSTAIFSYATTSQLVITGSYLNFGSSTAGVGGYGLRNNSGIIQTKNQNGSWQDLGTGTGVATFVGTTTATTNGFIATSTLQGYEAANSICKAEYSESFFCRTYDVIATIEENDISNWDGTSSWIAEGPPGYTSNSNDCQGWTSSSSDMMGAFWSYSSDGGGKGWLTNCAQVKPIACCHWQ